MTNRNYKIGKKARAARRIAAVLMTATLTGTIAATAPGIVQVSAATWSENADYIFEVLTTKLGYSEAAACGIMANIRCESTFNPHAWNAGGGSYGLCQWTGGRYGRLQSWCKSNGYDYTTIDGQLAYLDYELKNHYSSVENHLRSVENNANGAYDAGQYYCYHFEAPASRGSVSVDRGELASGTFWEAYRPAEWYFEDGVWRYIERDGSYHKSWLTIEDKTYYLDKNGNRISGWRTIDGNRYYFDKDGVMTTGWIKIDGKDYFFDKDGHLVTGLVLNGNDWYLLDEGGKIQASEKMEHFASKWVEAHADEYLASADEDTDTDSADSADQELASAASDTTASNIDEEASIASEEDASQAEELAEADADTEKKTVLPGIFAMASAGNDSSAAMPSLTRMAGVTADDDTAEETADDLAEATVDESSDEVTTASDSSDKAVDEAVVAA